MNQHDKMNKEKTYNVGDLLQNKGINDEIYFGTIIEITTNYGFKYITVLWHHKDYDKADMTYSETDLKITISHGHIKHHPANIEA